MVVAGAGPVKLEKGHGGNCIFLELKTHRRSFVASGLKAFWEELEASGGSRPHPRRGRRQKIRETLFVFFSAGECVIMHRTSGNKVVVPRTRACTFRLALKLLSIKDLAIIRLFHHTGFWCKLVNGDGKFLCTIRFPPKRSAPHVEQRRERVSLVHKLDGAGRQSHYCINL